MRFIPSVPVTGYENVFQVYTGLYKADGSEITFFETMPEGCVNRVLSDACEFLKDATKSGVILRSSMLVSLAETYGLKLTQEMMLFDDGPGEMDARKLRFATCLVALDGILRMWGAAAPVRIDPEMEKHNE